MTCCASCADFRSRRDLRGFTLMEILIVLAIVGLLFTVLFAAYSGTMQVASEVEERGETGQMVRGALSLIQQDLRTVYISPQEEEEDDDPGVYTFTSAAADEPFPGAEEEEVLLLRFATTNTLEFIDMFPQQAVSEIQYVFRRAADAATGSLFRVQRSNPELESESQEIEIADSVSAVTLEFLDADGISSETWYAPEKENEPIIPSLVHITMTVLSSDGREAKYDLWTHPTAIVVERDDA
ncbi:MAG: type II secretion system protein J [Desulfovibrionales bacterium]